MATLVHIQSGAEHLLSARHVVGRSRTCELQFELGSASSLHAEITWDGHRWQLRDLGSRNGTFVDGHRLTAGQQIPLEVGAQLGFGAPSLDYRFADDAPPRLMAFFPGGGSVVEQDGALCLPSVEATEVMVLCDASGRWIVEWPEVSRPVEDEEVLVVGDVPYRIRLPGSAPMTRDPYERDGAPPLDGRLVLTVSRDADFVAVRFHYNGRTHEIASRQHTFLLLELARARLHDQAGTLPEPEHGWMHRDDLMRELQIDDPQLLNLWVFRARAQFQPMQLHRVVIERRHSAGQLRIGLCHLEIVER